MAKIAGETWRIDLASGCAISTRLHFDGEHPRAFGIPRARASVMEFAGRVADTARGGPFNASELTINPHGNGTHTESAAHLVGGAPPVADAAPLGLVPCVVLSIEPVLLEYSGENYGGRSEPDDRVLTAAALEAATAWAEAPNAFFEAIVIRTLPNQPGKLTRNYTGTNPPYPTAEAMAWLIDRGVDHLLLDCPSLDREDDGGTLPNHRAFWSLAAAADQRRPPEETRRTVTEMIYVPDALRDGPYVLDLQVPDFALDASPSRPILFEVSRG